ncbi:MAG: hypothetical protein CL489_17815, partial [Acidobacteria bacterium]|nr:hypothetical protein [Acidobacteriota bacterium]
MKTFEEFELWDEEWCDYVRDVAQTRGSTSGHSEGVRSATRWWLDAKDFPEVCGDLRVLIDRANHWGFETFWALEGLPSVEVVRYVPGDFYKPHTDWGPTYNTRKISASVQLSKSEDYEGGQVLLHDGPEPWPITAEQG